MQEENDLNAGKTADPGLPFSDAGQEKIEVEAWNDGKYGQEVQTPNDNVEGRRHDQDDQVNLEHGGAYERRAGVIVAVRKVDSAERIDGLLSKLSVIRIRMDVKEVRQVDMQASEDHKHRKLAEHHEI
ncbi:hypothetical protein WR25_20089 [Diploscapter pachys]|uniref:Uncharacterized protein n=1 Tax=Diploscapter pachys TaxID=2018661 RepID=A0A2A2L1T2_9BILA|nr:hypothetical protein WR25_20089 [Diploscapter pachys]